MELAAGVILDGHYRLRQLLGRGGMGEVWEAEHTRLPKRFAIKFLLGLSHAEPELFARFKREAEIASRLAHPSIVQVTDFNLLPDGTAYIVMERLMGEDLRSRLARGPVPLEEVREIIRQVGSALTLAHREGIVHRDLKPENIFLCREGDGTLRAKVLDFGISKLQGNANTSMTRDDRVLGTPGYMAPEQALGKNSSIDARTDLFALASIVYEMLTGEGVFVGQTLAELCTKVLFHTPAPLEELLPDVPIALSQAVATALSKEPNERQADVRAFTDAVIGESLAMAAPVARAPSVPRATGLAATLASNERPLPSLAARAREAENKGPVPIDVTDVRTRSEHPAAASPSQPTRRGRKRTIMLASALVVAVLAAVGWMQLRPQQASVPPAPKPVPQDIPNAPREDTPPSDSKTVQNEVEPNTGAADVSAQVHEDARAEHSQHPIAAHDPGSLRKRTELPLSANARAALEDAERSLEDGDLGNALRLARNSLREGESERAYYVMARAYCGQHDVGMVQAMMRNLSSSMKRQVREKCQTQGLALP